MINYTVIESYEEKYAPPEENVLLVSVVGDQAFLEIGHHEEGSDHHTFKTRSAISVPVSDLMYGLASAALSCAERDKRERRKSE